MPPCAYHDERGTAGDGPLVGLSSLCTVATTRTRVQAAPESVDCTAHLGHGNRDVTQS
jgi:hypothetical protein